MVQRSFFLFFILISMILVQSPCRVSAEELQPDGPFLISKVDALLNREHVYTKNKLTVISSSGRERTLVYESWGREYNSKTLLRYIAPARIKGQAILMLDNADDIWMYFARTGRVRKLASHSRRQSMEGSDFSYEDIGGGKSFISDFSSLLEGEELLDSRACYRVRLERKQGSRSAYEVLLIRIRKDDFYPVMIEYFRQADNRVPDKRLTLSGIVDVQGVPTAKHLIMDDFRDDSRSVIDVEAVDYRADIGSSSFTVQSLNP